MKIEEAEEREHAISRRQKYDDEDRLRKEKEQMVEKKQTLAHDEEGLNTQEKVATDAINQPHELLNDATQKWHVAIFFSMDIISPDLDSFRAAAVGVGV